MHRKVPITLQLYSLLYPTNLATKPEAGQPPSFEYFARHHLSKEARHEARTFYGEDGGLLLRLAGLDYNLPHVRRRLSRCRHHRRLFAAFDALRLTENEIYELCTWDCTLWQKTKFLERHPEQALAVEDATGADVPTWDEVERQREWQRQRERVTSRTETVSAHDRIVGRIAQYLDVDERLLTPRSTATIETQELASQIEGDVEKVDEHEVQASDDESCEEIDEGVAAIIDFSQHVADESEDDEEDMDDDEEGNRQRADGDGAVYDNLPGLEARFGAAVPVPRVQAATLVQG